MTDSDLSLLQRLVIGLGFLALLLAAFIGFAFVLQARSAVAQEAFEEAIAPRAEAAHEVERAVMTLSVDVRGYLIAETATGLAQYEESMRAVRQQLQHLAAMPLEPDDRGPFAVVQPAVETYLRTLTDVVDAAGETRVDPDAESVMSAAREAAVAAVRRFVDLQHTKQQAALTTIADARTDVRRGLIATSAIMAVGLLVTGIGTARSIRRPVRDLLGVAAALQAGDWQPALAWAPPVGRRPDREGDRPRSEMTRLARAFGATALALEGRERRLRANVAIVAATCHSLHRQEVADAAVQAIAHYVQAEVGVVYTHDPRTGLLEPVAWHALASPPSALRVGEGIPGEAAGRRRTLVARDIPHDTPFTVSAGYATAPPRVVVAAPILVRGDLLGVIVLALLRDIDTETVAFLDEVSVQFGIGLQNARAHEEIERLVAELREQNGITQAQNEEIQAQNEQIQVQSEELQAQNEELQAQNEEIQAQNEQIRERAEEVEQQTRMLAEEDHRKDEFLAALGHELRNPMAALTVSLQVFNQSPPGSDRATRARAVIERQVQHLIRLIDDLLDITRISRGKVQVERRPIDLGEIAGACLDDYRADLEAKHLTVDLAVPPEPVWVEGDRTRLCQVVSNLLHNACKFTEPGGRVVLHVATASEADEAVLRVLDNGGGIPETLMPYLFEPFRQGATTLDRGNSGLGLGLALVKTLTELHGGTVVARSDGPGSGAEFTVRLPLRPAPRGHADTPAVMGAASERHWRVLLVEDNRDAAWSLEQALSMEGHDVTVVHSGPAALTQVQARVPDLVLCDIGLPGMDGYEVARRMRGDARLAGVPLIALTGYATPADRAQALEAGFTEHIPKPLDLARLRKRLRELDERRGLAT